MRQQSMFKDIIFKLPRQLTVDKVFENVAKESRSRKGDFVP